VLPRSPIQKGQTEYTIVKTIKFHFKQRLFLVLTARVQEFHKMLAVTSRFQALSKSDKKQDPSWRPSVLEWPMNLAVIWRILLGAYALIHTDVIMGQNCNSNSRKIRRHGSKTILPKFVHPRFAVHVAQQTSKLASKYFFPFESTFWDDSQMSDILPSVHHHFYGWQGRSPPSTTY
jgi:hypothetical protein